MTDKEQIWRRIAEMETPGFFITADIMCEGSSELDGLEAVSYTHLTLPTILRV